MGVGGTLTVVMAVESISQETSVAVLQNQYPRTLERPAAQPVKLPVTHRRYLTYNRAAERARKLSLTLCAAAASLLVLYIAGHARMTAVNYQRVQIISQTRGLKAQNELLRTEILPKTDQSAVDAWAKAHGMTLDTGAAIVLQGQR